MPEMTETCIELIIADDSNIVIECMKHWVKDSPKVELLAIVHSAELLKSMLEIHENAVILSSFYWITIQGKAKISSLISNNPKISYALFLNPNDYNAINELIDIGIKGFFGNMTTQEDMIKGLGDIEKYNYYMAPEIIGEFMEIKQHENGYGNSEKTYLTKRETEILKLILHGKSSKSIAKVLHISKRTVDGHRANINNKFGVKNTAQLYKKAGSYLLTF